MNGLTNIQKEILFGGLLGDMSLQSYSGGKSYRLRVLQSVKHADYVYHLQDIFKDFIKTPTKVCDNPIHKQSGKVYSKVYFNTTTNSCFKVYGKMFYNLTLLSNGYFLHKKVLPTYSVLYELLTDRSLAYWFMDDGSYKTTNTSVRFCTESFQKAEVEALCAVLINKYNFKATVIKHNKNYRLAISKKSFIPFCSVVNKYMHPSFYYKLGM